MKFFAIINNYLTFNKENGADASEPDWYDLPESTLLRSGNPFFIPDFDTEFGAYPSIAVRIGRLGKSISAKFAPRYVDAVGVGATVVALHLLEDLKAAGRPWTRATAFDRSLWLGNLGAPDTLSKLGEIEFNCGDKTIIYRLDSLIHDIYRVIERISSTNTMKNGDIILAGLTDDCIPLRSGTRFTARTQHETNLLDIKIK